MKNGKATGSSGIVAEMLKPSSGVGVGMGTDLINTIITETTAPVDCLKNVIVNALKERQDTLKHGNYRSLILFHKIMKKVENL